MEVYAIKVTLLGTSPPVWRRVLVQRDITLRNLHHTLQIVMGWTNSHLHQFVFQRQRYSDPKHKCQGRTVDESRTKLRDLIWNPGEILLYEYDFGDGWQHELLLEEVLREMSRSGKFVWRDSDIVRPRTVGGHMVLPSCSKLFGILTTPSTVTPETGSVRSLLLTSLLRRRSTADYVAGRIEQRT
jgi:hypothetical protein